MTLIPGDPKHHCGPSGTERDNGSQVIIGISPQYNLSVVSGFPPTHPVILNKSFSSYLFDMCRTYRSWRMTTKYKLNWLFTSITSKLQFISISSCVTCGSIVLAINTFPASGLSIWLSKCFFSLSFRKYHQKDLAFSWKRHHHFLPHAYINSLN